MELPDFVDTKSLGVLCTADDHCNPSGATVFYAVQDNKLYILTHGDSTKAKHVAKNQSACFVIVNETLFEQVQIYGNVCAVDKPADFVGMLEQNIEKSSKEANTMPPYTLIKGTAPVVLQLTPTRIKHFRPGIGLSETGED